jgi:hypothetical protein
MPRMSNLPSASSCLLGCTSYFEIPQLLLNLFRLERQLLCVGGIGRIVFGIPWSKVLFYRPLEKMGDQTPAGRVEVWLDSPAFRRSRATQNVA